MPNDPRILDGESMSTMNDVARAAGVSAMTVSRFFNQPDILSPATRERVRLAVEQLDYVPNAAARSLVRGSTRTIALVLTDITNPFFTTLARGVEDKAQEAGYTLMLGNSDESLDKERNYLEVLSSQRVDGVILAPAPGNAHHLDLLQQRDIPIVLVDRRVEDIAADVVRGDTYQGGLELVEHLIDHGQRDIAFVGGWPDASSLVERLAGYRRAMEEAGLTPNVHLGRYDPESGATLTDQIIESGAVPDAIVAANNLVAVGVLDSLRQHGIRVPEDVRLACFDDIQMAAMIDPFLTVVAQPAYDIGAQAMELLLDHLNNGTGGNRDVVLPTELIIRRSSLP